MAKPRRTRQTPDAPLRELVDETRTPDRNSTLVTRIEKRMQDLKLNPFSAAKKAGLGDDYVRDILRGKVRNPSADRLAKLAVALQCSLPWLLGGEDEVPLVEVPGPDPRPPGRGAIEAWRPEHGRPPHELLPVRYELELSVFRPAGDLGRALGFFGATRVLDPEFVNRDQWLEVVRDDHAEMIAPAGSLLHVVEYSDDRRHELVAGDFVIVERHLIAPNAQYYLVERTIRQISQRHPEDGLWFFEFLNENEISDDIFRDDKHPERDPHDEAGLERLAEVIASVRSVHLNPGTPREKEISPQEDIERLRQQIRMRPRVVAKVLRVIIPLDPRAQFGLKIGARAE